MFNFILNQADPMLEFFRHLNIRKIVDLKCVFFFRNFQKIYLRRLGRVSGWLLTRDPGLLWTF